MPRPGERTGPHLKLCCYHGPVLCRYYMPCCLHCQHVPFVLSTSAAVALRSTTGKLWQPELYLQLAPLSHLPHSYCLAVAASS